jgi:hypothetical protein
MTWKALGLLVCLVAAGCGGGRRVVVKPDEGARLGGADWTVRSEPKTVADAPAQ